MNTTSPGRKAAEYYDTVAANWDADHSARMNAHFRAQLRASIRKLLSSATSTSIALELGAGTGPNIDIASKLFGRVIGVDVSAGMLEVLARRVEALGIGNVTLLEGDACELPRIDAASVDVVYSVGLLETVPDYDRLFAESARLLRSGGVVAGVVSNGACPWYRLRTLIEGGERHARTGHLPTANELGEVLRRSGFGPPEFAFWGAVPPTLRSPWLISSLATVERVVSVTPLASRLAVMTFRAERL